MSGKLTIPADVIESQTRAANPAISAWVSANAGSGKTHVLASRVIRLLLDGNDPQKILCLTYTKASAAEMANRPDLMNMRRMVEVEDKVHPSRHAAEIVIDLKDGTSLVQFFDVGVPADDLEAQEKRLTTKFDRLAEPVVGATAGALPPVPGDVVGQPDVLPVRCDEGLSRPE